MMELIILGCPTVIFFRVSSSQPSSPFPPPPCSCWWPCPSGSQCWLPTGPWELNIQDWMVLWNHLLPVDQYKCMPTSILSTSSITALGMHNNTSLFTLLTSTQCCLQLE